MAVSKDQWKEARRLWEADAGMSLADVAAMLSVSRPAVTQHATKNNWRKASAPIQREELAHAVVDTIAHVAGRQELLDAADAALDLSVATRCAVINRHRNDWAEHRALFPNEALASDPTCARRAKIAAEAIALRQRGECLAHGLVTFSGQDTNAPLVEDVEDVQPRSKMDLALEYFLEHGEFPPHMMQMPQLPARSALVAGHSEDEQDTFDG